MICRLTTKAILSIADILCFSISSTSKIPEYLAQAKTYMDIHYAQHLTVESIAEYVHVSPSQLTRAFKKYYGETPYEYLLSLKIEASKILLTTSRLSVKEISASLNFCDEHYFSMLFRKKTGFSPSKYPAN
jgi:AraC-like DNA-binding protein